MRLVIFILFGLIFHPLSGQSSLEEMADHRQSFMAELLQDPRGPVDSTDVAGINWYDLRLEYQVRAVVILRPDAPALDIPTYSGKKKPFRPYADLYFTIHETPCTLTVYQSLRKPVIPAYADHLFLPFKDFTSGEETYGGGRYIDLVRSDIQDGHVWLDFNRAYNPWCAYSDGYNCPIPPKENILAVAIRAGELMYTGPRKQRDP